MHVCDQLRTEVWRPDFSSSGLASPDWTRVTCHGIQIANSLEWAEWMENPVQVILCDACGTEGCDSGGYVHVSRLGEYVLWSTPQVEDDSEYALQMYEPAWALTLGALAISRQTWDEWAVAIPAVPHAERFAQANHAALADAWILGPSRSKETILAYLNDRLVGGDTLEKSEAIALVDRTLRLLLARSHEPFAQPLISIPGSGARLETFYFDGPAELDWPAFAFSNDAMYVALDRQHMIGIEP